MRGRSSRAPVGVGACLWLVLALAPAVGAASTTLTVSPASKKLPAEAATGTLAVKIQSDQASIEVTVNEAAGWVSFTETTKTVAMSKGRGTATFSYTVDANESSVNRSVDVAVTAPGAEDRAWVVTQAGVPCVPKISSTKASFGFVGGEDSFDVEAPAGCPWTISVGTATWLTPTPLDGAGSGTVSYTVDPNVDPKNRTGKITLSATDPNTGRPKSKKICTVAQSKRDKPKALAIGTPTEVTTTEDATKAFCGGHAMFDQVLGAEGLTSLLADLGGLTGLPGGSLRVSGRTAMNPAVQRVLGVGLQSLNAYTGHARTVARKTRAAGRRIPIDVLLAELGIPLVTECDNFAGPGVGTITLGGTVSVNSETSATATILVSADACQTGSELAEGSARVSVKIEASGAVTGTATLGTAAVPFLVATLDELGAPIEQTRIVLTVKISDANLDDRLGLAGFAMTVDGHADETDLVTNAQSLVDLAAFSVQYFGDGTTTNRVTVSGAVRVAEISGEDVSSQEITFSNLEGTLTGDPANEDLTVAIDGTFAIRSVPAEGPQGTFAFATPDPLRVVEGEVVSGTVTVNGATVVIAGDSATVSVGGAQAQISIGESCTL